MAVALLLAGNKHLRHKLGMERTTPYAAYELARSVKDQTVVHLLVMGVFNQLALTQTRTTTRVTGIGRSATFERQSKVEKKLPFNH